MPKTISMRVAVLNYTGTVGKTMIAANVLKRRMPAAEIIAVESINETAESMGLEVKRISGERFREVYLRLLKTDVAIVDIGASNVEDFLDGMARFEDSCVEFDYFLIPVTPGVKEQKETIAMHKALLNFGIEPEKIKVVFNKVNSDPEEEFPILFKFASIESRFHLNPAAKIPVSEVFDLMGVRQTSLEAILADTTDYKAKIRELDPASNGPLIARYADTIALRSVARSAERSLDRAFDAIFGESE